MSWASHNPELYQEICNKGITNKLLSLNKWNQPRNDEVMTFLDELEASEIGRLVYDVLLTWAHEQVVQAEANYWGCQMDAARDRAKYKDIT